MHHSGRGKSCFTSLLQLYSSHPIRLRTIQDWLFLLSYPGCAFLDGTSQAQGHWLGDGLDLVFICGFGFFNLYDGMAPYYRPIIAAFPLHPHFDLRSYSRCNRLRSAHAKHSGNFDSSTPPHVILEPLLLCKAFPCVICSRVLAHRTKTKTLFI